VHRNLRSVIKYNFEIDEHQYFSENEQVGRFEFGEKVTKHFV
jgi:hypothetical protein